MSFSLSMIFTHIYTYTQLIYKIKRAPGAHPSFLSRSSRSRNNSKLSRKELVYPQILCNLGDVRLWKAISKFNCCIKGIPVANWSLQIVLKLCLLWLWFLNFYIPFSLHPFFQSRRTEVGIMRGLFQQQR